MDAGTAVKVALAATAVACTATAVAALTSLRTYKVVEVERKEKVLEEAIGNGLLGLIEGTDIAFVPIEDVMADKFGSRKDIGSSGVAIEDIVAVDCFCKRVDSITHHRTNLPTEKVNGLTGDSSTELVQDAFQKGHPSLRGKTRVTCNHFDIDAFGSVTSFLLAHAKKGYLEHSKSLLVETAKIGDFRELDFDALTRNDETVDLALKLCCLLNTLERAEFSRPFEESDRDKWDFFLRDSRVAHFVIYLDAEPTRSIWEKEYNRVIEDCQALYDPMVSKITKCEDIGFVIIQTPEPMHYYSLFSASSGCDMVLAMYSGNRYELEQRYTTFVEITSRKVLPRVCLTKLAKVLRAEMPEENWVGNRFVDSGPLLRIEHPERNMTKAERYGHAYERQIYPSKCSPEKFKNLATTFFRRALKDVNWQYSTSWSFEKLREFNSNLPPWQELRCAKASN